MVQTARRREIGLCNVQFWCRRKVVVGFCVFMHSTITLAPIESVWTRVNYRETCQGPSCPGLNGLRQLSLSSRAMKQGSLVCSLRRSWSMLSCRPSIPPTRYLLCHPGET